ncbi:MAG: type II toxin-antitoxin system HicA family toxin [Acidobacteriia bacterium]|nr:type II toxin-antitoxin system HicA family toxin [Terriglobia bacterium]
MSRLPSVTGRQVIAALGRLGFQRIRIRGSPHYLRHADGRTTVVPVHAGETIGPGLSVQDARTGCGPLTLGALTRACARPPKKPGGASCVGRQAALESVPPLDTGLSTDALG